MCVCKEDSCLKDNYLVAAIFNLIFKQGFKTNNIIIILLTFLFKIIHNSYFK